MTPFTVLLLRPDYMTDNFGQDTYLAYVFAPNANTAIDRAREELRAPDQDPLDYHCLFCTTGHHVDLTAIN